MFNAIIDNWHVWEGANGSLMISNEDTKKLYHAADIDMAVNLMYFEASPRQGRILMATWREHKANA